jgi:hypothetical protein
VAQIENFVLEQLHATAQLADPPQRDARQYGSGKRQPTQDESPAVICLLFRMFATAY